MLVTNLADVVRRGGLVAHEIGAWKGRHHGELKAVRGIVCHHTGSSSAGAEGVVVNGRADLEGPLANLTLRRDGSVGIVCSGQAWHAGTGSWPSVGQNNGNAYMLGIEAIYNGSDITPEQVEAYPRLCAALARGYGIPVGNIIGHREWAPGRKSDPGKIDLPAFRSKVAALLAGHAPAPAAGGGSPTTSEVDVFLENFPYLRGAGTLTLGVPVGNGAFCTDAYLSATVGAGKGSMRVFAQGPKGGVADWWHPEAELTVSTAPGPEQNLARRSARRIPAGTSVLVIQYDFSQAGPNGGTVTIEGK